MLDIGCPTHPRRRQGLESVSQWNQRQAVANPDVDNVSDTLHSLLAFNFLLMIFKLGPTLHLELREQCIMMVLIRTAYMHWLFLRLFIF